MHVSTIDEHQCLILKNILHMPLAVNVSLTAKTIIVKKKALGNISQLSIEEV